MNWSVYQNITVQQLRIGSVSNSSVLQIGTSGTIKALSYSYGKENKNEGESQGNEQVSEQEKTQPAVPLPEPDLKSLVI
ncbi:spore germination protein GerPB [Paenibacillus dakarensis]|uniref:spore germination protein GerPB n=1 Tax=Paenibacillus dakarensis TaxID=1527293 RepID=UPI0006D58CA7|nr:spore germination protein GerPB [Paenibacillus dakarensis]